MKKIFSIITLVLTMFVLTSCMSYKNLSDDKAKELGLKRISEYLSNDIYSTGLDYENMEKRYLVRISKDDKSKSYYLENASTPNNSYYEFNNNHLVIKDEFESITNEFDLELDIFLDDYMGRTKFDLDINNIRLHNTETVNVSSSKGPSYDYRISQTIYFKKEIAFNVKLITDEYELMIKTLEYSFDKNEMKSVFFDGYQLIDGKEVPTRYFVQTL